MNYILFFESYDQVLNIMAIAMKGLKVKPTYEDLIGAAFSNDFQYVTNS